MKIEELFENNDLYQCIKEEYRLIWTYKDRCLIDNIPKTITDLNNYLGYFTINYLNHGSVSLRLRIHGIFIADFTYNFNRKHPEFLYLLFKLNCEKKYLKSAFKLLPKVYKRLLITEGFEL